jgi:hypothetical protein
LFTEEVVLLYAEIANLEALGDERRATGSLSIMGFVDRAKLIEARLQRQANNNNNNVGSSGRMFHSPSPAGSGSGSGGVETSTLPVTTISPQLYISPLSPPATCTSVGSPASVHLESFSTVGGGVGRGASTSPAATNYAQAILPETRESENLVAEIFRAGAFVYLYSVLNGQFPSECFFFSLFFL